MQHIFNYDILKPKKESGEEVAASSDEVISYSAGGEPVAPDAFAVEGGRIYLQNYVDGEITVFKDGARSEALPMEEAEEIFKEPTTANEYHITLGDNYAEAEDAETGSVFHADLENTPIEMRALSDEGSYRYFFICERLYDEDMGGDRYLKYVYKYSKNGRLISVYYLEEAMVYVPQSIEVSVHDGEVYQLYITEKNAEVIRLGEKNA